MGQNLSVNQVLNKTCIILHHIWKYSGNLSYQAKNEVVRRTMLKKRGGGGHLSYHGVEKGGLSRGAYTYTCMSMNNVI